jgi:elongation factor G
MTGGRGIYTMEFAHYEQVPPHLMDSVISQSKKAETSS